jgi:glycosyltransferase involved in cell wall biosynthesis
MSGPSGKPILYVVGSLDLGGAETHLVSLTPRLMSHGWQPILYCLTHTGTQAAELASRGVEVVGPPLTVHRAGRWRFTQAFALALSVLKLLWLLLLRRPTVAHFFLPMSYVLGAPVALLVQTPICIMSRRSLNRYQRNHPLLRKLELRLHPHMEAVLGNSYSVVRELIEDENCAPGRVGLIYNGVDVANFDIAAPQKLAFEVEGAATSDLILVTVANLIPYKGHDDLLNALARIAGELPKSWTLLCVGRDDGYGQRLRSQARHLGLRDHVRFLGERRDVASLMKGADIGVLCSHEEGFANAILEGMAAGLPMIVTNVGGNSEAVVDEITGLVVKPHDPEALGQAILKLASDPLMRRRMGKAGLNRVKKHFSIDACVAAYVHMYESLQRGQKISDSTGRTYVSMTPRDSERCDL